MDKEKFLRRNIKLLYWIERHDFITPKQYGLYKDFSPKAAAARFKKLVERGYLDTVRPARQFGHGTMPTFYFITGKAATQISKMLEIPRKELRVRSNKPSKRLSSGFLLHTMKVNDFFTRLIDYSLESKYPGLNKWLNTRESKVEIPLTGEELRPDGYGEFDNVEDNICFWLELDRGTETIGKAADKFRKYAYYKTSGRWREEYYVDEYPRILFFTDNQSRARSVKKAIEKIMKQNNMLDELKDCYFLISWENEDSINDLLGKIWLRAGYDDGLVSFL